jgi:hypothetical protein
MGYACPVCDHPQADAVHLANHLALTAMARGGAHEDWLDDRVPDWPRLDEETLGDRLADAAEPTDYPQVFEDTTDRERGHDHDAGAADDLPVEVGDAGRLDDVADEEAEEILARARELTRERRDRPDSETE